MISFVVPKPPSANAFYTNVPGKGRICTKAYKAWRTEAGWEVKLQFRDGLPRLDGKVEVRIECPEGMDVDNAAAAILDLIQFPTGLGIIANDRDVWRLIVEKREGPWKVTVTGKGAGSG